MDTNAQDQQHLTYAIPGSNVLGLHAMACYMVFQTTVHCLLHWLSWLQVLVGVIKWPVLVQDSRDAAGLSCHAAMATINLTGWSSEFDEVVNVIGGLHIGVFFLYPERETARSVCAFRGK